MAQDLGPPSAGLPRLGQAGLGCRLPEAPETRGIGSPLGGGGPRTTIRVSPLSLTSAGLMMPGSC